MAAGDIGEYREITIVKILESIHDLREPAAFVTWARAIARSHCSDGELALNPGSDTELSPP